MPPIFTRLAFRFWLLFAITAVSLVLVNAVSADEPEVQVYSPAVAFDDHDERGRNGPDGPHPVVLMVVGKIKPTVAISSTDKKSKDNSLGEQSDEDANDLLIERVLFGSPPGKTIHIAGDYGRFPKDASSVSYIYGLASRVDDQGRVLYSRDDYYIYDRTYSIEQLSQVEALAQARLDHLVLARHAVFVGKSADSAKKGEYVALKVERVLHGPIKVGDRIEVSRDVREPVPMSGKGPYLYFIDRTKHGRNRLATYEEISRWSTEAIPSVLASLARRKDYPVRETVDEDGQTEREQEILYLGPRSFALELLQGHGEPLEILGARRVLTDGKDAIADVVKLVEKYLLADKIDHQAGFKWQENLIRILGLLEDHRTDDHVGRLIDEMLTRAESGANFPSPPPDPKDSEHREWLRHYRNELDSSSNHSLAWLLRSLSEKEAARIFGLRLLALRHVTAYGWQEEAQYVIDSSHIEDHLELAKLNAQISEPKPVRWQAGFRGEDLDHYRATFSRDGKWFAAVGHVARVWDTSDWSLVSEFKQPASVSEIAFSPDGESLFIAGGGSIAILGRWDWRNGKVVQRYPGHDGAVSAMQLSDDGKWLLTSVGYEGSTILFDADSGKKVARFPDEEWDELKLRSDGQKFLGRNNESWSVGEASGNTRQKLRFPIRSMAWATGGLWSLEEDTAAKLPPRPAPRDSDDDLFGEPARRPSILRQRRLDSKKTIAFERPISFPADKLLAGKDGNTVVALNNEQAEVFAAPEWKSVARWTFPQRPKDERSRFDHHDKFYELSADAKWLAVAEEYLFPKIYELRTGKRIPLGTGHSNQVVALNFADGRTLRTRDADGIVLRWNTANGEKLKSNANDAAATPAADDPWDRRGEHEFVAEDGKTWQFRGEGGGPYERYTSFKVQVAEKGIKFEDDFDQKPKKGIRLLGTIEPTWGQYEWTGLVPGGEYFHVGTQVFSRLDLKPVSAANVQGEIDQIHFTGDGRRYALLTTEYESRPSGLGYGIYRREEVSQRLRIHDTNTGKTLFAVPTSEVRLISFSPDNSKLATVNRRQEVAVWNVD